MARQAAARKASAGDYTARDIQVLEGLEAVRRRPGMYIGSTDQRGLHHLIYEIVDNSIDEAMAGFCEHVWITIQEDGHVLVRDTGRGIPIDKHPRTGKSGLETAMTYLHAGGKFGGGAYKVSGGLHGVGASVVNALSQEMWVEVHQAGKIYRQEYARGVATTKVEPVKSSRYPYDHGKGSSGTITCFLPDAKVFETLDYDFQTLAQRFREVAYLTKGVWIHFVDERGEREINFHFEGGVASFVRHLNQDRDVLHPRPIYIEKQVNGSAIEAAIQYNDGFSEATYAFANCINTIDGGSHLTGFRSALTRVINDYARKQKLLKDDDPNLTGEDVREGLVAVISVKLPEPQFEGQTKTRLGNPEVKGQVESVVAEELNVYLEEHPSEARKIIDKCIMTSRAREAARKARDLVVRKGLLDGANLPGKLADCSDKTPESCELYLVEGPSAGGTAKQGRDRRFQAILPLRGKVLNVEKARLEKMLAHEELRALIAAMGVGFGETLDMSKLRYHRVIIMTDADVDGAHIRTLLLTFFWRYYREMIETGYLYIAQPPLYRVQKGKTVDWLYSENDLPKRLAELTNGNVTVASKKQGHRITGQQLKEQLEAIRRYHSSLGELERRGFTPSLLEAVLTKVKDWTSVTLRNEADAKKVRARLDASGIHYESDWNSPDEEFRFVIKESKKGEGPSFVLDPALLETAEFQSLINVLPAIRKFQEGESYVVFKQNKEVAANISWRDLPSVIDKLGDNTGVSVQRYKGLGEMSAEQLWETTMDPERRTLLRVDIDSAMEAERIFSQLMGEEVEPRKKFIQAHASQVRNLDV